jgi:disulfide bond formation protein DsbB
MTNEMKIKVVVYHFLISFTIPVFCIGLLNILPEIDDFKRHPIDIKELFFYFFLSIPLLILSTVTYMHKLLFFFLCIAIRISFYFIMVFFEINKRKKILARIINVSYTILSIVLGIFFAILSRIA